MDVIGAGFGRTGTLSLKVALEQLGFGPCMHMLPLLDDAERAALFRKAAEGDRDSLRAALDGCRSTVDWPGAYFWRELVEDNPAAKVILTVRDPQEWYASIERTILAAATQARPVAELPDFATRRGMIDTTVLEGTFGGRLGDREHAVRVFEEHSAEVRRVVPAGRLLEFRVADGWEPLCAFLDRPVPDAPFPRLNDTATFQERVAQAYAAD
ncbi:MAG TPA: sulfotransferase [Actinoplanes sp.]|jgi:hypothetical protein|nr:sulfotransferase [Actinoplanes sp.]